ncbi:DNA replication/repair protein RecF [Consotaella salsifontis]|uniref:DNA replication/repair protein RecF n=1 Tax=Consotaella salsifontis TaxID=1365950 RepID=UPI00099A094E|nr:DNA replication/repair protein RecF [Consotaella salsifontis]
MDETAAQDNAGAAVPVRLTELRLVDFRNYAGLRLDLTGRFVVLCGENGAGKTNLLEAVSLLSPGRGLRRAAYPEMARGGASGFAVRAGVEGAAGPVALATTVRADAETGSFARQVKIDETPARTADELLDHLRILWLTPAMDGLFTGPAGDRRRFLDRLVLTIDPAHGRRAADYERAMRSRNRLLADGCRDERWLEGIEAQMAELGIAMALARRELTGLLRAIVDAADDTPFPKADLVLSSGLGEDALDRPAADMEDALRLSLARSRFADAAAGRSLEGPHRADLAVFHRAKAMPAALSSTGEQKALLIGLILAHASLVSSMGGATPVLLLDEIAAHLDAGRRAALFDLIDGLGVQSFLTGTDPNLFEALGSRAQHLTIRSGTLA